MDIYLNLSVFKPEYARLIHTDLESDLTNAMKIVDLMTGIEFIFEKQKDMLDKVNLYPDERIRIYQQLKGVPKINLINNQKEKDSLNKLFHMDKVGRSGNASLEYADYELYWLVDLLGWREARFGKDYDKVSGNIKTAWTPEADKLLQECVKKRLDNAI